MPFPAQFDLATLDGSNGFRIDGVAAGDENGYSVSWAGDVNGDGFDDIIVGSPFADPGAQNYAGHAYVIFGKTDGFGANLPLNTLDGSDGFRLDGFDTYNFVGFSVSGAGDVNGDGYDDLVVGSFLGDVEGYDSAGNTYVLFGKESGFAASLPVDAIDGSNGFRIEGAGGFDYSGYSVSSAGDVNGDGFDDLIIGAWGVDPGGDSLAGASYVVFGKENGFGAALSLSALDGTNGLRIDGVDSFDYSGFSVSGAGDVNGDGYDDLTIGAYGADPGGNGSAGEIYVVSGKENGFASSLDLSMLDGTNGFLLNGIDASDRAGYTVSGAGDINNDGFDDIVIGAWGATKDSAFPTGETYVVLGKADSFDAAMDLASLDGTNGFRILGIHTDDRSGYSVSGAGDINDDGFDDILIGAYTARPDESISTGAAYVYFGKAGGFAADFDLGDLDGTNGFALIGIDASDRTGFSVSSAGDVNGDGVDDIVIGNPTGDPGDVDAAGESYVVFGQASDIVDNTAPVASPATASAVEDGPVVTGQLVASDADGDPLTFSPILTGAFAPGVAGLTINSDGSYSFDPAQTEYQSLAAGETVDLLGGFFVSDGSLTDSSTLTITITGANDAPSVAAAQSITVAAGASAMVTVAGTDIDGDSLGYSAGAAGHGTVDGGTDGEFIYTPDAGYTGTDTFLVTVSDGNGGTAAQTVTVNVSGQEPIARRLFASDGFAGAVGGSGSVLGAQGFQDIAVLDGPDTVTFDPSFNRGGDIIRLAGDAGDWTVKRSGSAAVFNDGDTAVNIPVGTAGLALVFDDGARNLRFDAGENSFRIGDQAFAQTAVQVTAAADGTQLPTGADHDALARLFLAEDGSVTAAGTIDIFGTAGEEMARLLSGDLTLDPSFNRGGDSIALDDVATDFKASQVGSGVLLDGTYTAVLVPVGTAGATLSFAGSDERVILFDTTLSAITIGGQVINSDPVQLAAR